MKNNKTDIWVAISSFLNESATEEEKRVVDAWLQESEKNKRFLAKLKERLSHEMAAAQAIEAKEKVFYQTQMKIQRLLLKKRLRLWQSVAAASVALLLVFSGLRFMEQRTENALPIYVESKSPAGSVTQLTLSDGTIVELNACSSISYPLQFTGNDRTVKLNGEAYFEVAENKKKPFIVETNDVKVRVLGTHFNVKSYNEDAKIITTLMEGSVRVGFNHPDFMGKSVVLFPDQQIILDKNTHETNILKVKSELYASWKDGQCFFENEKLADIAKILERQFGVMITVTSTNIEKQLYSGFFSKREGLLQILNSFKKYRNFDYKQTDDGIEIFEK